MEDDSSNLDTFSEDETRGLREREEKRKKTVYERLKQSEKKFLNSYLINERSIVITSNMSLVQISEIIRLFIDSHYGKGYILASGQLDQILSVLIKIYPFLNENCFTGYVSILKFEI